MSKIPPGEVPPPAGFDATPEQRAAAVDRMAEDSRVIHSNRSHISTEIAKLQKISTDKSVIMHGDDILGK